MTDTVIVLITNAPDEAAALRIANALVEERLAACVNLLAPCRSIYRWEGRLETATEIPMLIKTSAARYQALERRFAELHPYEVPELLSLPVRDSLAAYSRWVIEETRPQSGY